MVDFSPNTGIVYLQCTYHIGGKNDQVNHPWNPGVASCPKLIKASYVFWTSLVAQKIKGLPAMRETRVRPWVGKILWRRKLQPTPVLLPGKIPWMEERSRLQSMESLRVGYDWVTSLTHLFYSSTYIYVLFQLWELETCSKVKLQSFKGMIYAPPWEMWTIEIPP